MKEKAVLIPIQILFVLLTAGLVYTQILRFPYYSRLSRDNAIRIIPIEGPRGTMFDRNGVPLVNDRISFNVAVVYHRDAGVFDPRRDHRGTGWRIRPRGILQSVQRTG